MALVFKVKYQDVLRRWVASEALNTDSFSVTFGQLEAKIKELFHLSPSASLAITYVDKDNDVVMLADDQDLIDACIVQRLNPLRLDVQVLGVNPSSSEGAHALARSSDPLNNSENVNIEAFLNALFPQATADAVKRFLRNYIPFVDPKLPAAACLAKAEKAFREFLHGVPGHRQAHPKLSERFARHHPTMHPHAAIFSPHHGTTALHWGIECDGCGMVPIEGTRYKSMKKTDYDLCASCLEKMGNESDYEKLDQPVHHRRPPHSHYRPPCFRRGPRPFPAPQGSRAVFTRGPYGWRPNHPFAGHQASGSAASDEHKKLDARFVKDVTIFDGTELAPGSKFTKIWRMANIGTLPWPESTQLVHIGGDRLCAEEIVTLELPEGGLPCGEEVEVCVDLTAPPKAGRYVSHWRLTAPSGQKFGHRVWVVIHVVPEGEHSPQFQASLQNGKGIVLPNNEVIDVDLNDANTVMVDVDLNGASTVVLDVVFDEETAAIDQLAAARKGPHHYHEDGHPSIVHPDPFTHGSRDVDMPIQESVEVGRVVDDETATVEERIAEKSTPDDHQNVHPSVVHPDPFDHGSKDVDTPIQKAVEAGAVVEDASAAFEQLAVGNSAPRYDHPSVVSPDPFHHGSKDVDTPIQKAVEVGAVVDDASAAFEQLAVRDSDPHYDNENVHPSIVYPDPFAHGSKDVGRSVEGGATTSVVYPDPTYVVEDMDMSREKPSEEDVGRKTEVDDGFSFVEKPTENTDWVEVIENEGFDTPEGQPKEGEEAGMESLLQALESMGFEDRNVNISVLQYCNFVLQDAVNDLVAAAGWDGALKDLEEMGFNERDTNIRLLVKNKGSLKQTVRELVKLEKTVMEG